MTEFEIVSSVMNLVTSHEGVTNTSLSPDQIALEVDSLRVRMIEEMDKYGTFRKPYVGFLQTIPDFKVTKASTTKTIEFDIPRLVMRKDNTPAYMYIGGKDGQTPYRVIVGSSPLDAQYDMFVGKFPIAVYEEGHVTLHQVTANAIRIVGVFNDPSALEALGVWNSEENHYPLPEGMIDQLIGKTANSYINSLYRTSIQPNTQSDIPVRADARR